MGVVIRVNNFDSWWWRDLVSVCGEGQNKMWFDKQLVWKVGDGQGRDRTTKRARVQQYLAE